MQRSTFRRVVSAVLCALIATGAGAQGVLKRIADRGQLTIGYSEFAAPFSFEVDGQPGGYSVELCRLAAERIGRELGQPELKVRYVAVPQDQMPRLVSTGAVDLMCAGTSDTAERRRTMAFSAPIFLSSIKLMVRKSGGPHALSELREGTVAVFGRTTAARAVEQLSTQRSLALKVSPVVSTDAAMSQLRLKQADAWARDEVLLLGALARQPDGDEFTLLHDVLSSEVIAIAMPRDDRLVAQVNAALGDAVRSGRMATLYTRWFVQPNPVARTGLGIPLSPALNAEFERLR